MTKAVSFERLESWNAVMLGPPAVVDTSLKAAAAPVELRSKNGTYKKRSNTKMVGPTNQ